MLRLMWSLWRTDRRRRPWRRPACLILLLCLLAPALPAAPVAWASGVSTGDGAWTWQNPSPQGNDLHHIRFADADTGWAVGRGGLILRTTDGGRTWAIQESGTNQALYGLAVLDSSTGVVVGTGGAILTTSDGGAAWTSRPGARSDDFLTAAQYADPATLYAVGLGGAFLKSVDGGETWYRSRLVRGTGEARVPVNLWYLQFLDANTGYVLADGPAIFATGDGAQSWRLLGVPAGRNLHAFVFLPDGATALAVGDGGLILKTDDGGETWRGIPSPTAADLYVVAYGDPETVHVGGDGGVVLKSVDGGESWAPLPEPRPSRVNLRAAAFVDAATGYAAGFNGTVLKTTDGGATWTNLARGPRAGLRTVHFVSREVAVAAGEQGAIAKSADGGNTWRAVRSGTERNLNSVRFLNRQTGFAVGDGGVILRTDDAGETWHPVPSPVGLNLRAIGLAGNPATGRLEVGLIVGDTNLVLRSEDQGRTWRQIVLPGLLDQLFSVHFPEPRIGYVGGLQTIWQSQDFGRTWRIVAGGGLAGPPPPLPPPGVPAPPPPPPVPGRPPRDPLAFAFPTVNRGYAVGVQGQMFRTNDGGTTWAPLQSRTTRTLRGVHFVDEHTGYVVGDEGTILLTNNGGQTWAAVNSGTHLNLWGVQLVDRAVGLAVGEGGAVLKTTSGGLPTRTLPPSVVAIAPPDGQTNVVPEERIRITFSKDVRFDPAEYGEAGRFQLRDRERRLLPARATYDASNRQVVITPAQPLRPGAAYTLTVRGGAEGVADLDGRTMVFEFRSRFRTDCAVATSGGFGLLIARDATVREQIGCPATDGYGIQAAEQPFERGHMLWRADTRQIVVTYFDDGRWASFADTYQDGETLASVRAPEGLLAPERGFGKLWRQQPGVRDRLGWATTPERSFLGAAQDFDGGIMIWTGTEQWLIRVHYHDGTTLAVPDPNRPR